MVKVQIMVNSKQQMWVAAVMLGLIGLFGRHALYALAQLAWSTAEYSHILLVPPIVLAFLLSEKPRGQSEIHDEKKPSTALAVAAGMLLITGLGVAAFTGFSLTVQIAGLVLALWMGVGLVYGWGYFRASLFPMLFLLLLIPWPAEAVAWLTRLLQSGSTSVSYWLFKIAGVNVVRQGFVLSLPTIDIEVAKECSGIRSTIFLFITALVLGQWYLQSPVNKTLVALAVLPIGIFRNAMRIFILSMLGAYVNEGWLDGNLHHRGGVVFFVLGLALIVVLLWYFQRTERASGTAKAALGAASGHSSALPGAERPRVSS